MPEVRLNASDAAELAELLQFLSGWLARDPGRLASRLRRQPRPTAPRSCRRTWTVSSSCSAATTAGNCSADTAIMPTVWPPSHEDSPLRSRRPARGYRSPPGTAFCAVQAVIQQSVGIGSSNCSGTGVSGVGGAGFLLAVCLDQALDQLVDVARLGQLPSGQPVAQLGLGEALVALAGLVMSLPGLLALGEAGLASRSFSACSACCGRSARPTRPCHARCRGDSALSRTRLPTDSARSRTSSDSVPAVPANLMVMRRLMLPSPARNRSSVQRPGSGRSAAAREAGQSGSARPAFQKSAVLSIALRARLVAELYCLVMLVMYSLFTLSNFAYYIKQVRTKVSGGPGWRPVARSSTAAAAGPDQPDDLQRDRLEPRRHHDASCRPPPTGTLPPPRPRPLRHPRHGRPAAGTPSPAVTFRTNVRTLAPKVP